MIIMIYDLAAGPPAAATALTCDAAKKEHCGG